MSAGALTSRFERAEGFARRDAPARSKALVFAWTLEVLAVGMGLVLAVYAGFEGSGSGPLALVIATMPFLALAAIELTKIPLVALYFRVHHWGWKVLAVVALVAVTTATFENFVFGFERGFNERLTLIQQAEQRLLNNAVQRDAVRTRLDGLAAQQAEMAQGMAAYRAEIAAARAQARDDVEDARQEGSTAGIAADRDRLAADRRSLDARRDAELAAERARCNRRVDGQLPICGLRVIETRYATQAAALATQDAALREEFRRRQEEARADAGSARARRDAEIEGREARLREAQGRLDGLRSQSEEARASLVTINEDRAVLDRARAELVSRSQVHRLSHVLLGGDESSQVERVKKLFVVSLSAIVALIGTVVAVLHYAAQQPRRVAPADAARAAPGAPVPPRPRRPVLRNALRAWILSRRRRAHRRVREVVREVPVDRLKIVYLPLDATEAEVARIRRENAGAPA
ncbi:hypothetical protein [Muricoccus radiodurans]|uniref:hypothetical protein n=1 Tax=Muricoccus radiodurans TaxID=2231721 RepID=UPI003CF7C587